MDSAGHKRKYGDVSSDDDDADSPPRASFRSFNRAASRSESPPTGGLGLGMGRGGGRGMGMGMGRGSWNNNNNAAKSSSNGPGASSFGARMLAKMGYVQGQGLGSSGQGIVNPIEAQARPQGIGLGAVREKSKQAREEEKRAATLRGESVDESSDEEIRRKKKRQPRKDRGEGQGEAQPIARKKPQFRTAREIEADMAGLEVPNVLKSLIDATGKEQRVLTSTAGLMTPLEFVNTGQSEAYKIARRARQDLEAFADEWKGLTERKQFIEQEESQIVDQLDSNQRQIDQLTALVAAFGALNDIPEESSDSPQAKLDHVTNQLESIEIQYRAEIDQYRLWETAVAAIHPIFREAMEDWEPLKNPTFLVSNLRRLQPLLSRKPGDGQAAQRQSTSPYETMIYTLWLPRVRSALLNDWEVFDSPPATTLIVSWKELLPSFVYANVLDQLIVPKLTSGLKSWKPSRRSTSSSSQQNSAVPWWLFTWLQYLDERHTDPKQATGLLTDAKRKFRSILDKWDLSAGPIRGLDIWRDALSSEFDTCLRNHLLPRLAAHLRNDFDVNPQDQDLTPFENILKWKDWFQPNVLGLLFVAEFFPKFHQILYIWLTNDPNYEEVAEWFTWWRSQFPPDINNLTIIDEEWNKALRTMDLAAQLGERATAELPPPTTATTATSSKPTTPSRAQKPSTKPSPPSEPLTRKPKVVEEVAFKDVLESWCAEEGLIMLPLREAHPQNGQPLFRVTASATGKGGVIAFIQGDVVWVQNKKSKDIWEPMGLEERLVERAEGR
ncbi:GC-rich sequence DNA-binding factor-like protein-domain-containing protein [Aspergillus granulosus]|uniref:GC-rich sequence DNA-binding factor-like protein-domain-containing protein n=1 Tax=Aspergillus granulosus TaxID=176169 RepID=A0ABR4HV98_9EURO